MRSTSLAKRVYEHEKRYAPDIANNVYFLSLRLITNQINKLNYYQLQSVLLIYKQMYYFIYLFQTDLTKSCSTRFLLFLLFIDTRYL